MPGTVEYLRVRLERGMFANEYTVTFNVGGRTITSVVNRNDVRVEEEPTETKAGRGLLAVRVLEQSGESVLVDLPRPSFTSEPRLVVPRGDLVTA